MMDVKLIDKASANTSKRLGVRGFLTAVIDVSGTATAAVVKFKGAGTSGVDRDRMGINLSDYSTGIESGMNQSWELGIGGLTSLLIEVSGVTGGNVTVNVRCY